MPATEARQDADTRQEQTKRQRADERAAAALDGDRRELAKILTKLKTPETKTAIRSRAPFGYQRFGRALPPLWRMARFNPSN